MPHAHESVTIMQPREKIYEFWRSLENLPRFMQHLESVQSNGDGLSHWVAKGPAGTKVEWDAEILEDRPNEKIVWQSMPGADVPNSGSVQFADVGDRQTEITVDIEYEPPAGGVGAAVAKLFGEEPGQQLRDDLGRLKQALEAPRAD
ncbi:MAG TPA: SRPBCC family protein [Gemmatimonadaceae bacterium]|nr:SRPBCC family protein [Gemmatimonadaceae bacterium]